jgi:hypothetical protein
MPPSKIQVAANVENKACNHFPKRSKIYFKAACFPSVKSNGNEVCSKFPTMSEACFQFLKHLPSNSLPLALANGQ